MVQKNKLQTKNNNSTLHIFYEPLQGNRLWGAVCFGNSVDFYLSMKKMGRRSKKSSKSRFYAFIALCIPSFL